MIGTLELPEDAVQEMKEYIRREIYQPDKKLGDQAYADMLRLISHPAAILRVKLVKGASRLQRRLNLLIAWQRASLIAYPGIVAAGIFWSWWSLVALPVLLLLNMTVLNNLQTRTNVELAARLFVMDKLADEDMEFGQRINEAVETWVANEANS